MTGVTTADPVRRHARENPHQDAVIEVGPLGGPDAALTWRDLDERAERTAALLLELGLAPGEAVAYQLPNRLEFAVLSLAVVRIGAVCCPLMPIFREREVDDLLRRSHARVFVICDEFRGRSPVDETASVLAAPRPPGVEHVLVVGGAGRPPDASGAVRWHRFDEAVAQRRPDSATPSGRRSEPDAVAQLMFTSGTSGEPKGVLHTRATLDRAVTVQARHLGLTAQDRLFIPSPLAHQTGFLYGMWLGFVLGASMVLQPVWDGPAALAALRRTDATFVQAATPFLTDLVDAVDAGGEPPKALRVFVATGTAVPRALAERATRTLGAAVCGAWGSTESCLGTLAAPTDEGARAWGTDGRAPDGVRIRVTDDDGRVLPAGMEGNFEVSGDCLFVGYLDHPELTAAALTSDGWYRSGDLAVIDESGYARITGRVKDVINRGGEKIPVAQMEQLLHTHPAVRDIAIVAMPDRRLGERACAFVVAGEPFTLDGMRRFLDDNKVAKQYWPERLEIVAELPRNAVGKVQKFVLRKRVAMTTDEEER